MVVMDTSCAPGRAQAVSSPGLTSLPSAAAAADRNIQEEMLALPILREVRRQGQQLAQEHVFRKTRPQPTQFFVSRAPHSQRIASFKTSAAREMNLSIAVTDESSELLTIHHAYMAVY
jgi:hypothetical protein